MILLFRSLSIACSLWLLVGATAAALPVITGTNSSTLSRSGRLSITGTEFGTDGTVLVGGLPALNSTWTDTRIVAYVPEAAPLGPTSVVVVVGGQQSNAMPLTVTTREADGRVNWVFEIDYEFIYYRPERGPDGTVYNPVYWDNELGALSPFNGAIQWVANGPWTVIRSDVEIGPDDTLYFVGSSACCPRSS